jgi:hypothetical protein
MAFKSYMFEENPRRASMLCSLLPLDYNLTRAFCRRTGIAAKKDLTLTRGSLDDCTILCKVCGEDRDNLDVVEN